MPDYFDRLLARYTPVPAAGSGPARVRPRLPGPFERVEALRSRPPEPDQPAALIPSAPQPAFGPAELVRHEREVRTDRETVVRTEAAAAAGETERRAVQAVQSPGPLLRPAVPASVVPRQAAPDVPRAGRRGLRPSPRHSARRLPPRPGSRKRSSGPPRHLPGRAMPIRPPPVVRR